jgi:hypothetical protein
MRVSASDGKRECTNDTALGEKVSPSAVYIREATLLSVTVALPR